MFHFLEANPWSGVVYEVRLCIKKQEDQPVRLVFCCDSARIQTWNLLIRSQVLYSVKLRSRLRVQI